jgi:hypothetical protein
VEISGMTFPSVLTAAFAFLASVAGPLHATGQAAASASVAARPVAINPLYTMPPASVTAEQVASMQQLLSDWPQLGRYRDDNARLPAPAPGEARVVFFGDSIRGGVPGALGSSPGSRTSTAAYRDRRRRRCCCVSGRM